MAASPLSRNYVLGTWRLVCRGGTWYRHGYTPGSGVVIRYSLKTKSFDEAKAKLKAWFYEHDGKAVPSQGGPLTLADCLERYWLRHASKIPSARVIKTQMRYWNEHFGAVTVEHGVTFATIDGFKRALIKRNLAPSTINHTLMIGRAAMRMAWKRGELAAVPSVEGVKVGDQESKGRPLTVDEMRRAYQASDGHLRTLILFLIGTAARPCAIYDLEWERVDRENELIYLNAPGRVQNKKYRPTVRLPALLAAMEGRTGPVVSWDGTKMLTAVAGWRKARKRAGLDGRVNLYSFRATASRWMRKKGVSVDEIQTQLGHRKEGETARYMGFEPEYLANACRALNELLELVTKPDAVSTVLAQPSIANPASAGVVQW